MRQVAPNPEILEKLVEQVKYKAGWSFSLEDIDRSQGSAGLTLIITLLGPDTYKPEKTICVNHYMIVPAAAFNERAWRRWLFDQILLVEQHEAAEFFQVGDDRPYAPSHAPGNNPYVITDHGTIEDATTDYRGNRFTLEEKTGRA